MNRYLQDFAGVLPKEKPSLAEIAAMPFPASMVAMRKFYNKDWHKPEPDGETPCKWRATVRYTTRSEEMFDCEVEAASEAEAKEKAEEAFDKRAGYDDEIEEVEVELVEPPQ